MPICEECVQIITNFLDKCLKIFTIYNNCERKQLLNSIILYSYDLLLINIVNLLSLFNKEFEILLIMRLILLNHEITPHNCNEYWQEKDMISNNIYGQRPLGSNMPEEIAINCYFCEFVHFYYKKTYGEFNKDYSVDKFIEEYTRIYNSVDDLYDFTIDRFRADIFTNHLLEHIDHISFVRILSDNKIEKFIIDYLKSNIKKIIKNIGGDDTKPIVPLNRVDQIIVNTDNIIDNDDYLK